MILITGGLGFIGSHTARALLDLGEECVLAQRRPSSGFPGATIVRVDIGDREAFLDIGTRYPISGIVHLAGAWGTGGPIEDARLGVNGLLTVFEAARAWGVRRVCVASTIGVYGGVRAPAPYREDMPLPMTAGHPIPAFKKIGELLSDYVADTSELDVISMRIGAVWGPGGRPVSQFFVVPQLIHAAVNGTTPPRVHTKGAMDLCYARDCGRAIAMLQTADRLNHRVYNVSSGTPSTHADVVAALRKATPEASFDLVDERDPRWGDQEDVRLDITRLREDTGFAPAYELDAAVADYVAWLRAGNER